MNDYPYTIPANATLLKTGLYYTEKLVGTVLLRTLYADYGWAIYNIADRQAYIESGAEEPYYGYSYLTVLAKSSSVDEFDVVQIETGMEVTGKPSAGEVM